MTLIESITSVIYLIVLILILIIFKRFMNECIKQNKVMIKEIRTLKKRTEEIEREYL